MDMISTGRATVDRDLVNKLVDTLREEFLSKKGQRLTIGQIRQNVLRNMNNAAAMDGEHGGSNYNNNAGGVDAGGRIMSVSMAEIEDAVRTLNDDGILQYVQETQTAIIR